MTRAQAESFAAEVLAWLAEDHARIVSFLAASGIAPTGVRDAARDPGLLLAVIEFLMADEALLVECCRSLGVPPTMPSSARSRLPGGEDMQWT
jgi:hypothetical protein